MIVTKIFNFKYFLTLVFLFLFSCAHRDDDSGVRNNPYDPGGDEWIQNSPPVVMVSPDSLWEDFNHACTTGSMRLYLHADDQNFPYDSLFGSIYCNGKAINVSAFKHKFDSSLVLSQIKPNSSPACTVKIVDSKGMITTCALKIPTPRSSPVVVPSAIIVNSSQNTVISWVNTPKARYYAIYYSDKLNGTYDDSIFVIQTGDSIISISDPNTSFFPRYYILSATDSSGTSRSTDTLIGRKYSSSVSAPVLSSVSQGSYLTHITLSIYSSSYSNIDHFEILRSENDTSSFRLVGSVKSAGSSTVYYNDSVNTLANYYYRITAINKQGLCSFPSTLQYGFLRRLPPPDVAFTSYDDNIHFNWSLVSGAVQYRTYRSSRMHPDSLILLNTSMITTFTDTPPNSDIHYYKFSSVDDKGREGSLSGFVQAKIRILPKPDSVAVSFDLYPRHVALSWKKIEGAIGYIIYRDTVDDGSSRTLLDTIISTSCIDSLPAIKTFYYQVTGYNKHGIGIASDWKAGSVVKPQILSIENSDDTVSYSFSKNMRAALYYIYRSTDTTGFILIDSSFSSLYKTSLNDFSTFYYRITIRTPEGVSYPSSYHMFKRQLNTPSGFALSETENGVHITWNPVKGAESYEINRSKIINSKTVYQTIVDTTLFDTLSPDSGGYYYRVAAKNGFGVGLPTSDLYGGIKGVPLTPASITVIGHVNTIHLSWSMPINSSQPDGFRIYRSTNANQFTLIGNTKNKYYDDTVPDAQSYSYQISAYNSKGESNLSAIYSSSLTYPSSPTTITASFATNKDCIYLTWSPVNSIIEYSVYRSLTEYGLYGFIGNVKNTTEYRDTTCDVNVTYFYAVVSVSVGRSSEVKTTARGNRLGPPEINSIALNNPGIRLYWKELPYPPQYYNVYRADELGGPYIKIGTTTSMSFIDTMGNANSYYKVSSFKVVESDLSPAGKNGSLDIAPSVNATQGTIDEMVEISWTALDGAYSYTVYRAPTYNFDQGVIRIADVSTTSYTDTLYSDSVYYYKITALKSNGKIDFPNKPVRGYRNPYSKPHVPPQVFLEGGTHSIQVGWQDASTSIGYDRYLVYRSTSSNGPFEKVASIIVTAPLPLQVHIDNPPQYNPTVYYYYVTTVNQRGESEHSKIVAGVSTPW